jgi:hypothetical protein
MALGSPFYAVGTVVTFTCGNQQKRKACLQTDEVKEV